MKSADHSPELEQVMAYVDGALDARTADRVRTHIAGCAECGEAERDLRRVSEALQSWNAGDPPRMPAPAAPDISTIPANRAAWWVSRRGLLFAAASIPVVLIAAATLVPPRKAPPVHAAFQDVGLPPEPAQSRTRTAASSANESATVTYVGGALRSSAPQPPVPTDSRGPMIVRNARLSIIATDYEKARRELEAILQRVGGFVGSIVAQEGAPTARTLQATLRVPTGKLDEAISALRQLGQVVSEAQDGEDVTQQSADLDTRLENARVSEKRLRDILAQRTGKLSDVLDVEREVARVRGEIEQMEAERRSLNRRVTYATVTLSLSEDRKSEVNLGPVPVSRRIRNAFVEGWNDAISSAVNLMVFIVQIAPTLLLWGIVLTPIAYLVRRRVFGARI